MKKNTARPKAIWLFAGGAMQEVPAKKIKELGYKLIVTDMDPECVCARHADTFINLDTFDIEGNIREAKLLTKKYSIQAVFTAGSDCHEAVACVAKELHLPGVDPKLSSLCRYKLKTRELLTKAGVPQPRFATARTLSELRGAVQHIGLPVVVKSSNNSGSRGFSYIQTKEQVTQEVLDRALEAGTTGYALVEQVLVPVEDEIAEQSVETVWYNGTMYWLNWVDRLFRKDFHLFKSLEPKTEKLYSGVGWGVELAHVNPALHKRETKQAVYDMIHKAGLALGMGRQKGGHILKADIMLTDQGPFILEMTLRLSGGWDSSMTTPLRGADFTGGALQLALGGKLDLDFWHSYFEYKNPEVFASIIASVAMDAQDCIGRTFAAGTGLDREQSLREAYNHLIQKHYVSVE